MSPKGLLMYSFISPSISSFWGPSTALQYRVHSHQWMWVRCSPLHQPHPRGAPTWHPIPFHTCQPLAQLSRQCSNFPSSWKPSLEPRLSKAASLPCPHGTLIYGLVMLTAIWNSVISPLLHWIVSGSCWHTALGHHQIHVCGLLTEPQACIRGSVSASKGNGPSVCSILHTDLHRKGL